MRLQELDIAFGFSSRDDIRDNFLVYNDEDHDKFIFVNGRRIVSFDPITRASFFFPHELSSNVTCLIGSLDQRYVASACKCNDEDESNVFINKISSRKLVATFCHQGEISAICFSSDSQRVIAATSSSIIVWDLKKESIIWSGIMDAVCNRISCPSNVLLSKLIACVSGPTGYFTLLSAVPAQQQLSISFDYNEGSKDTTIDFIDHAWICNGEPSICTIALIAKQSKNENTNILIYAVHNTNTTQRLRLEILQEINSHNSKLFSITSLNKESFAVSGTDGMIFSYKHDGAQRHSQQRHPFTCSKTFSDSNENCFHTIKASSISNNIYVANFYQKSIFKLSFEYSTEDTDDFSEIVSDTGHVGGVSQLDSCYERPIIISSGMKDSSVSVWDYTQKRKIAHFDCASDEPLSLAMHPSGYYAAVGFQEKLITFHILADSVKPYKSLLCHNAVRLLSFSAKYLAAVVGNTINLYEVYPKKISSSLILISSFSGHIGPIKCICWNDDSIFSGGSDKNLYGWNISQSSRIDQINILRGFGCCESIAFASSPMKYDAACITTNGSLHRLFWSGYASEMCSAVTHKSNEDDTMSCLAFNSDGTMLVVGTFSGSIKCFQWSYSPENFSFHCISMIPLHRCDPKSSLSHSICTIKSSADNIIISGGTIDGSIFALSLGSNESSADSFYNEGFNNVILVAADDYESKSNIIQSLQMKMKHLVADSEFKVQSRDMLWRSEIDSLSRKLEESVNEERERYQVLLEKYEETVQKHKDEQTKKDQNFESQVQELTAHKIEASKREYAITEKLQKDINDMRDHLGTSLDQANTRFQERLREIELEKVEQNKIFQTRIYELEEELSSSEKIYREVLEQQEEEFQYLITSIRSEADTRVLQKQQVYDDTKMTLSILRSEKDLLMKMNEELKSECLIMEDIQKKESSFRRLLQEEKVSLECKLSDLYLEVKLKSEQIMSLENKLKTVLDSNEKLTEDLKMEKHSNDSLLMNNVKLNTQVGTLNMNLGKLKTSIKEMESKQEASESKFRDAQNQHRKTKLLTRALKRELALLAGMEESTLKKAVEEICEKYKI